MPEGCPSIVHSEASLGWGGQEHRVLMELQGFKDRGSSVTLLAPKQSEIYKRSSSLGLAVKPLEVSKALYPVSAWRLCAWLRSKRIKIVNTHSSRDGYLVGVAARLAKVPLLIRSRHIDVSYPNPFISRHAFTTFADHVLTTSDKIAKGLCGEFGLNPDCITTVPTGIDLNRFCPKGDIADLRIVSGKKSTLVIGMISVLRSWKGHSVFIDALKHVQGYGINLQALIVGEGPQRGNIEKRINGSGQSDVIKLIGHREDIPQILRALDILVIPSTGHEGIPQIGLQALACGTAVIGTDAGGIPEIVIPDNTGRIVPANNAEELALAIKDTFINRETTNRYIQAGVSMVTQNHSQGHMLNKLEGIYRSRLGAQWEARR